jgi:hypothetical protein
VKMGLVCSNYETCKLRTQKGSYIKDEGIGVMTFAVTIWILENGLRFGKYLLSDRKTRFQH